MNSQLSKSLSGLDIINKVKSNLVQYKDLKKYKNIDELLGKYKKCVLLYHTAENYGHWTCLYEHDNKIYFFDSYGLIPDDELKFLHKDLKKELNSNHKHLTELLYNSDKPIEYNEYELQSKDKNVATCGRWIINRLKHTDISVEDYYQIFKEASKDIDLDLLISLLEPV